MKTLALLFVLVTACNRQATPDTYHPPGYRDGDVHGTESNLKEQICVNCHGADLTGDPEIGSDSCDGCHHDAGEEPTAWRTDCTFCHGGGEDLTGAPPEDIHGAPTDSAFGPHTAHVSSTTVRTPLVCDDCHVTPDDILSIGHMYDATAGVAETDFSTSIAPKTTWDSGTCSNSYCHGSGQGHSGTIEAEAGKLDCDSCHAGQDSSASAWRLMSGTHGSPHLEGRDGVVATCSDCHAGSVQSDDETLLDLSAHIDGLADVAIDTTDPQITLTYEASTKTCTGSCHGVEHSSDYWYDSTSPHPPGFAEPDMHGIEAKLNEKTDSKSCNECHGADLAGDPNNGLSCDTCHNEGESDLTAWRTDCTFCHGGKDNTTGAPPEDIHDAQTDSAFGPHTVHVDGTTIRTALTCTDCHDQPESVLSPGHMFDATAGVAETDFSQSISAQNVWNNGTCSSSYCHGNGQGHNGTVDADAAAMDCASCHAGQDSSRSAWRQMSGTHADPHLQGEDGIVATCSDCHSSVVASNDTSILSRSLHINGTPNVVLDPSNTRINMTYNAASSTCNGSCHGENHNNENWFDD